ncbi:two-component sensor histidine kinase [Cohnella sp. CIP 111063]|uniref:sensor histidine kinase n=1 Tax=unclassified Cohnella TaxID=2636738 RepID=UPI000B8BCAA1|nr:MULTISPECIES: HAMP domain-containing sensor histidine kinase [unclassified Cohnella]OXS54265.1 two-component sensor histidine kinase [Cohnella sp. CIP 111063]PRX63457.1 phospho-acceptor domain-containing protein [Cohnella sp. SGD-V74]
MFTRLRNRFLLMNMVIITVMMLVAFASIYTITFQNVNRDIEMELHRVSEFYRKANEGPGRGGDWKGGPEQPLQGEASGEPPMFEGGSKEFSPPERSVSFALMTDASGNLLSVDSRFGMEDEFYETAADKAASKTPKGGRFTLDGTRWAYSAQPESNGYMIVYMDVTAQQKILTNLIYTFAAVALVMLAVIYATSRYFANRSIAPVREAFDKQKRFIADASHELKTPLAVIQTNADVLLANETETIGEQAKWLHRIKSETERMKTLTNDLLYLTQMDDSKAETLHVPFNVSEAVESVVLAMEAVIFERSLSLDYTVEPGLTATGSAEQIKQVVMILLDNAIKYNRPDGTVGLTLRRHHGHIQLAVTNSGSGIPAEHLDKVFDRFYRTDASRSRKQGGYGLGLAIAKSIVEQHRGKIQARSVPGETTTFVVQLG